MTKEELLSSAGLLIQPSKQVSAEYGRKREQLAADMNRIMGERPDIEYMVGGNRAMMDDNHRNHARFLESLFSLYSPSEFVETVIWVFRAYRSHGFQLTYWPAQLDTWVELLRSELSPEAMDEIYPFYRWMIVNQHSFVLLSDSFVPADAAVPKH
ncbi:MAG: hypothetical protein WCL71_08865 [Deltaproteobacteria bacterium]